MLARVPMSGGTPRNVLEHVTCAGADFEPHSNDLAAARAIDGNTPWSSPSEQWSSPTGLPRVRCSELGAGHDR
jgi:hypothetical protein